MSPTTSQNQHAPVHVPSPEYLSFEGLYSCPFHLYGKRLNARETRLPSLEIYVMLEKTAHGLVYECVKCGAKVTVDELELRGGGIKCTFCGYRVLKKIRPPVVKRVAAK